MRRVKGKRYDNERKLNVKKVVAFIVAIIVLIMVIISFKDLLSSGKESLTKDVSTLTTYISIYENNKWGVIDNKGNKIIEPTYDEMIIIPDKNKPVFVCTYDVDYTSGTYKTKVLNENGKIILEDYELVEALENATSNEVWYEKDVLKFEKDGKYGLIDYKGKVVIEPEYSEIKTMSGVQNNLLLVKDGKVGAYNIATNEIVIEPLYQDITALTNNSSDGYIVKNDEGLLGLIAADKKQLLECKYTAIKGFTGIKEYIVTENGTVNLVDEHGKVIGSDSIEVVTTNYLIINKSGKYGVITKDGGEVIKPEYDKMEFAFENYFIAEKDGKKGLINSSNETKINFEYVTMNYVTEAGIIVADVDAENTDIINSSFEVVLEDVIVSELNVEYGYLRVRDGEDYKYYNFKLEEKTNIEMLATNTLFLVKQDGKYGYVNKNGDLIVNYIYDDATEQNQFGYCAVKKDGLWGVLKSDGTVILKPSVNLDDYLYVDFIAEYHRYNDLRMNVYTK